MKGSREMCGKMGHPAHQMALHLIALPWIIQQSKATILAMGFVCALIESDVGISRRLMFGVGGWVQGLGWE